MARSFNGSNQLIDFGDIHLLIGTGSLTAVGWFKNSDSASNNYHSWFSSGDNRGGGGSDAFNFEYNSQADPTANSFSVNTTTGGGGTVTKVVLLATADTGIWHHCAGVWTAGTGLNGYLDGVSQGTSANVATRDNPSTHLKLGCGNTSANTSTEFSTITSADLAIWTVPLTANEIAAMAKGVRPYMIRPSGLIFYSPVDGISAPEPDYSGNRNNGTITGAVAANDPPLTLWTPKSRTAPLIGVATGVKNLPPFQRWAA